MRLPIEENVPNEHFCYFLALDISTNREALSGEKESIFC